MWFIFSFVTFISPACICVILLYVKLFFLYESSSAITLGQNIFLNCKSNTSTFDDKT